MQAVVLVLLLAVAHVWAYIPAVPTNDTNAVNQTDMSMLSMKWAPAGTYSNVVSFQLSSLGSLGFSQGALVHFSEKGLTDQNSTTPWIALVNCDANTTDASEEDDIFTLARDRGAVAALLYSVKSEACLINPEYASPDNFDQILDIFATQSKSSAGLINSQFTNLHNSSFGNFDAVLLNNSAASVQASMTTSNVTSSFIVASLRAANSTISPNGTDTGATSSTTDTPSDNGDPGRGNPNTGLAMIILYAITGCVSALFIVVILSGAVRAIRHPERYGPRAGGANGGANGTTSQSRTGGIGRAILDTFPIIKFGQTSGTTVPEVKHPDVENQAAPIEMDAVGVAAEKREEAHTETPSSADGHGTETTGATTSSVPGTQVAEEEGEAAASTRSGPVASSSSSSAPRTSDVAAGDAATPLGEEVRPGAIGHETCPICIVDFQEGDDLRVLPCEGKHKFHQTCVDPWLLELSTSCPLCREDFHALESMMVGNEATEAETENAAPPPDVPPSSEPPARSSRFSRYLKIVRRRNRGAEHNASSSADAPQTDV